MNQLVLWFDIVSFAVMSASAGLTYVVYTRNRAAWLRDYLVYALSYGLWVLFAGWIFFQQVYLSGPLPQLVLAFAWVRVAVSVVIAYFGPMFFLRVATRAPVVRIRAWVISADAALALAMLLVMLFGIAPLARAASIAFNVAFTILSWAAFAAVRTNRASPARPMIPVILYSAVGYTILAALTTAAPALFPPERSIQANVMGGSIFVFGWAVIGMIVSARWLGGREASEPVPPAFINDHGITPREAEILRILVGGRTASQIAEELFISQRTVEAHLYNVYRKCGVRNRVELVNRIADYRG